VDELLRPLGLLLLPAPLDEYPVPGDVAALQRAGRLVAVDPPRVSYQRLVRLPRIAAEVLAQTQARRLVKAVRKRGDRPRVVVVFEPEQYLIARAILSRVQDTELWYRQPANAEGELHDQAIARATLVLDGAPPSDEVIERLREAGLTGA
jgi:hypothetical protein